mmetsp:Transcript_93852/g.148259  ORF Transcript_93852/g.148259 Transcript_93852/m.148259 type:complete len:251 (+) Transcript_93852:53-805(+)
MSLQYELIGANLQALKFTLRPGQKLIAEAGAMMYMDDNPSLTWEPRLGNGSTLKEDQGWWSAFKAGFGRVLSDESLFFTWFTNNTSVPRVLAIAAPMMGTIVPVNMNQLRNRTVICQPGAFLCCSEGVVFRIELVKKLTTGFFAGEGFILQRMTAQSGDGQFFMHGGGQIVRKDLRNETLTLDPGCMMAYEDGINFSLGPWQGMKSSVFAGQWFVATVSGTGSVWVQSTPESKMIDKIIAAVPQKQKQNN